MSLINLAIAHPETLPDQDRDRLLVALIGHALERGHGIYDLANAFELALDGAKSQYSKEANLDEVADLLDSFSEVQVKLYAAMDMIPLSGEASLEWAKERGIEAEEEGLDNFDNED